MEINPTTLVILGVICVVMGFIASSLLGTLREDSEAEPSEEIVDQAPPGGRKGRYTPVTRLWRERQNDRLIVEIDGKSLVSPAALSVVQRERLEQVARDLHAWLGMGLSSVQAAAPERPRADLPETAEPHAVITAPSDAPAPTPQANPPVTPPAAPAVGQVSASAPKPYVAPVYKPAPSVKPARGKGKPELTPEEEAAILAASKSIVAQIEDVLQERIAGGPFDNRGIHLIEDPYRGVIVTVDANRYEGIESVADPEVKAVIKSAVAEWEKRQ